MNITDRVVDRITELKTKGLEKDGEAVTKIGRFMVSPKRCTAVFADYNIHEVTFIDGGQADIFGNSTFCLSLLRAARISYNKNERTESELVNLYLIVKLSGQGFHAQVISDDITAEEQKRMEAVIVNPSEHGKQINARTATGKYRRLLELIIAERQTAGGSMIVLDGDLESTTEDEKKFIDRLTLECDKKGVLLTGLSKSTEMRTANGTDVTSILNTKGTWYHEPFKGKDGITLTLVKLHDKSRFVFKFEVKGDNWDAQRIVSTLAAHSRDPVFPGYPYGLIKADQVARVSNREKEYQRTILSGRLKDIWTEIVPYIDCKDAHKILDTIG